MKMQYLSKHVSDIALGTVDIVWRTMTVVELLVWITALFCQLATYTAYSLPVYDCTFINYCQPPTSDWWKCRSNGYFRCPSGKRYHCAKDYDSPEVFKEGCAIEKFCQKGEEPFLSFKKDGRHVKEPEVYCRTCADKDRYNNKQNTSSAEYSECPDKKWNICTEEEHKKLCKPEASTEERFCRCDARNGFYPMNDNSNQKCSYKSYDCGNYRNNKKCGDNEELLLNYTCAAKCDEGFARFNEDNDNCDQLLSVKQKNILILSTPKTIDNGTTTVPSTKTQETECDEECDEYQICDSGKCVCREVCAAVYDPVCGYHHESDSYNTFSSKCQLGRHYCQQRKFVFYANGECKQNKGKECYEECEEYQLCDSGKCVCREVCAAVHDPVCGYHQESDTFKTFTSKCEFGRHYCQYRKFVLHDNGECKKDNKKVDPTLWIFLSIMVGVLGCFVVALVYISARKKKCCSKKARKKKNSSKKGEKEDMSLLEDTNQDHPGQIADSSNPSPAIPNNFSDIDYTRVDIDEQVIKGAEGKPLSVKEDTFTDTTPVEENSGNEQAYTGAQPSDESNDVQVPSSDTTDADVRVETESDEKKQNDKQVIKGAEGKPLSVKENTFTDTTPVEENSGNEQAYTGAQPSDESNDVQVPSSDTTDADVGVGTESDEKKQNDKQVIKGAEGKPLSVKEDTFTDTTPVEENSGNEQAYTGAQPSDESNDVQVPSSDTTDADVGVGLESDEKKQNDKQVIKGAEGKPLSVKENTFTDTTQVEENSGNEQAYTGAQPSDESNDVQVPNSDTTDADVGEGTDNGGEKQNDEPVIKGAEGKPLSVKVDTLTGTTQVEENSRNEQTYTGAQLSDESNDVQVPSSDTTDADVGVGTDTGEEKQNDKQIKNKGKDHLKLSYTVVEMQGGNGQDLINSSNPVQATFANASERNDTPEDADNIKKEQDIEQDLKAKPEQSRETVDISLKQINCETIKPSVWNAPKQVQPVSLADYQNKTPVTDINVLSNPAISPGAIPFTPLNQEMKLLCTDNLNSNSQERSKKAEDDFRDHNDEQQPPRHGRRAELPVEDLKTKTEKSRESIAISIKRKDFKTIKPSVRNAPKQVQSECLADHQNRSLVTDTDVLGYPAAASPGAILSTALNQEMTFLGTNNLNSNSQECPKQTEDDVHDHNDDQQQPRQGQSGEL